MKYIKMFFQTIIAVVLLLIMVIVGLFLLGGAMAVVETIVQLVNFIIPIAIVIYLIYLAITGK
jgi:hypothetical protein